MLKIILATVGWKPLAAIGGLVVALQLGTAAVAGWQTLRLSQARESLANSKTHIAELRGAVKERDTEIRTANRSIGQCQGANQATRQTIDTLTEAHKDQLLAIAKERDMIAETKQRVRIVERKIDASAASCQGDVHPAIRDAVRFRMRHDGEVGEPAAGGAGEGSGRRAPDRQPLPARRGDAARPAP